MIGAFIVALAASQVATAQQYTPLVSRRIPYDQIPYKVDTVASGRGPQAGHNLCNATTEGPTSLCQTAFVNSLDDFCLWGLQNSNEIIGDREGEAVAWCTKEGHGTRIIPPGAITGAQFIQTPEYVSVVGMIQQTAVNIAADDAGGEMDSAGADGRGNPLGGLVYSTAFGGANGSSLPQQIIHWTNFMGNDHFCIKACVQSGPNAARQCEHVYDRIGCATNIPSNAYNRAAFETCEGDVQLPVGVYVSNGRTSTWYQPPEGQPIGNLPYTPVVPPSSSCSSLATLPSAFAVNGNSYAPSGSGASSGIASASGLPSGSGLSSGASAPTGVASAISSAVTGVNRAVTSASNTSGASRLLPFGGLVQFFFRR